MPVHGGAVIRRRMRKIVRNVRAEVIVALDEAAEDLLSRADQLAPQLSGEMIGSGDIAGYQSRHLISRTIFYASPYAVRRHEDFYNLGPISSLKRSPDGEVGRKYLSRPFEAHNARYQREIGDAIGRAIRQSVR